ncbi:MAG: 50S ribosomal protein L10 [Kiritimatiellia bacterium]|jgi:large subunit ribosomal protein L10
MKATAHSRRPEKVSALKEITELVAKSDYCFILNYGSLTVSAFAELRRDLAKVGAAVKVVKNAYLQRAVDAKGWAGLQAVLVGPTALVTGVGDPAEVAKALVAFLKKNDKATVKGGQLEATTLTADEVDRLSELPSKDAMRGMLLGTMMAPATGLVRVLVAPLTGVLYVLKAKEEKDGSAA